MRRFLAPLCAVALAGCAANPEVVADRQARAERDLAEAIKGRVPGAPVECISSLSLNGPQIIGDDTLVYRDLSRLWVNKLDAPCPGLSGDPVIVIEMHGSQLCRLDRFRAVDRVGGIPSGSCMLGKFTPYTKQ